MGYAFMLGISVQLTSSSLQDEIKITVPKRTSIEKVKYFILSIFMCNNLLDDRSLKNPSMKMVEKELKTKKARHMAASDLLRAC